jgi:chemotaxis family two-component system response regulator Rcp1
MPNSSRSADLATPRRIEVLVVQSNPADTLLTIEAFHSAGLTTGLSCVTEGDALNYVGRKGKYSHAPSPDLVFLDLSQPRISGLEVLKVIKSTPELMHIPIVVAAGSDDPKFVRAVYALNGNCFIRKPGELQEFVRFIESCYEFWSSVVTLSPHPQAAKYCAKEPLLAILAAPGMATKFITIVRGSVITVEGYPEEKSGFVDVLYDGQVVKVYMRDIEKSADRVESQNEDQEPSRIMIH